MSAAVKYKSQKNILLVDDNRLNIRYFSDILAFMGHNVIAVSNPDDVLPKVKEYSPDLIIMDFDLKHMVDGIDLINSLRLDKSFCTPIIGSSSDVYNKVDIFYGLCNLAIPKPLTINKVQEAVSKFC